MDIMKEQKPVGPSWKGFEQIFLGGGWFHPYLGKWSELTNIFQNGLKAPTSFLGGGLCQKEQTWLPEGMRELWFLIGMVFWDFGWSFLVFDPLAFKDKSVSFSQASKRRTHKFLTFKSFTCIKRKEYIDISYSNQDPLDLTPPGEFPGMSWRLDWLKPISRRLRKAVHLLVKMVETNVATTGFPKEGKLGNLFSFGCFWEISVRRKVLL